MINTYKKIIFYAYILFSFNIHINSAVENTIHFNQHVIWEKYSSLPLWVTLVGLSCYGINYSIPKQVDSNTYTDNKELTNFIHNLTIIYPHEQHKGFLQSLAKNIQLPIMMIEETYIQHNKDCLNYLFGKAYELKPCIIYIIKNTEEKICPSLSAKESFIFNLKLLQNIDEDIIVLGTSKNKNFQSPEDIAQLSFHLEKNNPSYAERLEFLEILLRKTDLSKININLEYFTKKTLGFSYQDLYNFIKNIQNLEKSHEINESDFEKSLSSIIKNNKIYQSQPEDLYHTCVHETGHAIMTALLNNNNFKLHNTSITPHHYDACQYLGVTEFTKNSFYNKSILNHKVQSKNEEINYQHIKISFAGMIAEQIIFGLSNKLPLTPEFAFENFIKNPEGATHDLYNAIKLLHEHNSFLIKPTYTKYYYDSHLVPSSPFYKDLYELYKETLQILLPLKHKIIEIAQLLEQKEFLMGSEIHSIIQN